MNSQSVELKVNSNFENGELEAWSNQDKEHLLQLHNEKGNKWVEIGKILKR